VSGTVLTHKVSGAQSGDPVLLLNGGLMTFASWGPIADDLGRAFPVIAFDFRGMLLSPGTPPPTLDGHVDDVVALLDHLRVSRVHAVGTSFGAEIAVLLAAARPERVQSLVLVTATEQIPAGMSEAGERLRAACGHAAAGGDGGVVFDLLKESAFSPRYCEAQAEAFALRRQQFAAMPQAWFEGLEVLLDSLRDLDLRSALARIGCPTLVVGAELDATFPPHHSRALADAVPGARLEIVAGSGHALVAEQPARLLDLLWSFLPSA
jgi:3-oxoadipate enol-lactonase